jgi:phosphoenolpyruvate carboxykinase (ATP)
MASNGNEKHEGEFEFASLNSPTASLVPNGLSKINTKVPATAQREVCKDDTSRPVKVANVDELHALQKKKASAPSTPRNSTNPSTPKGGLTPKGPLTPRSYMSEEERHSQQMHSISASLASLTREVGPQVVSGDPARKRSPPVSVVAPRLDNSDSSLKFTHVLYNLSPAELYEQAIKFEKGSYITASGALATLSGAKTGRSPKDKRVVREETSQDDLWWGKGSPNIEMDEETFLVNRERAVDYLNSLEKVFVNDQFLNWDEENRIKVRIISARAYHSLFMHNM